MRHADRHDVDKGNPGVSRARMERAREDLAEDLLRNDRRLWADA